MAELPIFLSVVLASRNQADQLAAILTEATRIVGNLASDYELIVVDNASEDDSVNTLKRLTGAGGLPNLQVFALTREVDADTAAWVGLENALGDFIAVIDPMTDDIGFLPQMLEHAVRGTDVVFATNERKPVQGLAYKVCFAGFNMLYRWFNGIHLAKEAPQYRVLSRRVVNYILQHPMPAITYRHLPATGGFTRVNLAYSSPPKGSRPKRLMESINHGMRLLVSTTRGPMRVVTSLSLLGATSNLIYSAYVIAVALFKADVEPGWVTLSLQQSGMFFLISLVLLVLGEYILNMASLSNEGPLYHIAQEFTSAVMTRREKLNIEETRLPNRFPENKPEKSAESA
jgi:hypothetical protein